TRPPPSSSLFPYTTLFRSRRIAFAVEHLLAQHVAARTLDVLVRWHARKVLAHSRAKRRIVDDERLDRYLDLEPRLLELGMQQHATGHLADGDNVVVAEARERTGPINQPVDLRALGVDLVKLDVLGGLDLVGLSEDETRDDREQRGARSLHAIHFGFLRSAAARVEARARPVA